MKTLYILLLICIPLLTSGKDAEKNRREKASAVAKELSLDARTEKLLYNISRHIENRLEDVPMGAENYKKLIKYIDQEREQMLKSALSLDKYDKYDALYGEADEKEIKEWREKHRIFIKENGSIEARVESKSEFLDFVNRAD